MPRDDFAFKNGLTSQIYERQSFNQVKVKPLPKIATEEHFPLSMVKSDEPTFSNDVLDISPLPHRHSPHNLADSARPSLSLTLGVCQICCI
jgi:hypothetical protein